MCNHAATFSFVLRTCFSYFSFSEYFNQSWHPEVSLIERTTAIRNLKGDKEKDITKKINGGKAVWEKASALFRQGAAARRVDDTEDKKSPEAPGKATAERGPHSPKKVGLNHSPPPRFLAFAPARIIV